MSAETFVVTIEVEVEGAAGGWNPEPILDAVGQVFAGVTPKQFRHLTIERKTAREPATVKSRRVGGYSSGPLPETSTKSP